MKAPAYITDTAYPETFFRELSPVWIDYVAALNGARAVPLERPFRYLELGCGFAHSTVVNAAAFPKGEFHACDLNPQHIEAGRRHAAALGVSNLALHEASFDALAARELPRFDFIVLHGVYTWVGPDARSAIRRILREKLAPGGLVYLSYNCLPGWTSELPLRRLLVELAATATGDSEARARQALRSLEGLRAGRLQYLASHPAAAAAVDAYARGPSDYLAHEFLNESWEPLYSLDVADELAPLGLRYVGSATLPDNHPLLVVDEPTAQAIAALPSSRQQQLAMDFAADRRFRRDVFVRDEAPLSREEARRQLDAVVIGCLGDPEAIAPRAPVPRGEVRLQEDFIGELRALMRAGSLALGEATAALAGATHDRASTARNLLLLVAAGTLTPFARAQAVGEAKPPGPLASPAVGRALARVIERQRRGAVPSEVAGNGVEIEPGEALAIRAALNGEGVPDPALLSRLRRLGWIA